MMLLAASLATPALHAQTADTAALTPILKEMASVPQSPALTADQRAAKLGDMALLPADTEMYLSLPHIDQTVANLQNAPLMAPIMMLLQQKGIRLDSMPVTSFTIATGPGSSAFLAKSYITLIQSMPHICNCMGQTGMMETTSLKTIAASVNDLVSQPLPPVTVIAGLDAQTAAMAPMFLMQLSQRAAADPKPQAQWHEGTYAGLKWQGAKLIGKGLAAGLRKHAQGNVHADMLNGIADKLATRDFYILVALKDNKAILTITENPEKDIKLAATPGDSILATSKVAFADARLDKNPDMLCYIDAIFSKNLTDSILSGALTGNSPMEKQMIEGMMKMTSPAASSMLVWADKGIHLEAINGNTTAINLDCPLTLIGLADKPETVMYTEGALSAPGFHLYSQYFTYAAKKGMAAIQAKIGHPIPPQMGELVNGLCTAFSGMNGRIAILMDNKGTLPDAAKLHPIYEPQWNGLALPRLAMYSGISDRTVIDKGWGSIETAAKQLFAMANKPNVQWPVQTVQQANGISTYSFKNDPENSLNPLAIGLSNVFVSISDTSWAIGGSPDYTSAVVAEADRCLNQVITRSAGMMTGAVFALRFAPIQDMVNKDLPILQQMGVNTLQAQGILSFIFSQVDGLYATMNRQGDTIRTHYYFRTK